MQVKGIFFDLGGTLFSYSGRMGGSGIGYVLKELGITAAPEEVGKAWGAASKQVGEHYGRERYFLHQDLFRDTMTRFLAAFDHEPSESLLEEFHQRQLDAVVDHLPIREECHTALQALKDRGLYLSIVSNIDDDYLDPLVEKNGLSDFLNHWTSSEEAQSCKPDPDIFHYSVRKSGLHKDEVLFVGDSLHHDVAGADAVGMRSVRIVEEGVVTPLTHGLKVTADPTFEISNLNELVNIVEQHNGS
jgi:2-haloalkanoic acid dehalogenase type II